MNVILIDNTIIQLIDLKNISLKKLLKNNPYPLNKLAMKSKTKTNNEYQEYLNSPNWKMTILDVKNFHKIETKKSVLNILFSK